MKRGGPSSFAAGANAENVLTGRRFTALYSNDSYTQFARVYDLYAMDPSWDASLGTGPNPDGSGVSALSSNNRQISWIG